MSEKLEPCPNPWCLFPDSVTVESMSRGPAYVACRCGVKTHSVGWELGEKKAERQAIKLWNTRSDPQREAMRSALKAIVAVGPPVRGVDELWSSWQARKFAAYELARAALEVK